jgi:hypothetical protein
MTIGRALIAIKLAPILGESVFPGRIALRGQLR